MHALTIAGVVPLCFVLGTVAIRVGARHSLRLSAFDRAVLAPVIGIAALTPVFVILGVVGLFSPLAIGITGWVSAVLAVGARARRRHRAWHGSVLAVLVLAMAFVVIAALGRDEPWGAGRDQQVYAEFAEALSLRGTATASLSTLDDADRALIAELGQDINIRRYLGVVRVSEDSQSRFASYLPLGWPVWLAFAHAIDGERGLSSANILFAALGAVLLYVLSRRIVGRALAAGAAGALLALPSTIWIAGTALSEPLALTLWLAIAALLVAGGERALVLAAMVAFSGAAARVDFIAVVPVILAALVLGGKTWQLPEVRRGTVALCVSVAATLIWYRVLHPAYFYDKAVYLGLIGATSIALTAVLFLQRETTAQHFLARTSERLRGAAIVLLVVAFAYCVLLRPSQEPYSLFRSGLDLDGTRDFREDSLWNLAAYLGWPLLGLAVAGLCIGIWRWSGRAAGLGRRAVLMVTLLFGVFYLWFPNVSPDHPWAVRRLVPAVIPGAVLFAAYALRRLASQDGRRAVLGAAALVGLAVLATMMHGTEILTLRENAGVGASVDDLARQFPAALVVADLQVAEIASALFVAKDRSVLVADLSRDQSRATVAKWIDAKAAQGNPAWLLHLPELSMVGVRAQDTLNRTFERDFTAPTMHAPARTKAHQEFNVVLSRVDGFDDDALFRRFGAAPVWGVAERGFFPPELTQFGVVRLTNGSASLRIPSKMIGRATALVFDFFLWSPSGKARNLEIRIDGRLVWNAPIPSGVTTIRAPLWPSDEQNARIVEIASETFETRTIDPEDHRGPVGVALLGARFERASSRTEGAPGIRAFRSRLEFGAANLALRTPRDAEASAVISAANIGSQTWPSLREQGVDGAVQFGLRWYGKGPGTTLLADNRWPLALTLLPGEQTRLRLPLVPIGLDGSRLPPGEYSVSVGMVREKHAWFADDGDPLLKVDVTVVP